MGALKAEQEDKTHSSVSSLEAIESLLAGWPCLSGYNCLDALLDDLPEPVVFLSDQQDDTCALAVKGAWHV